MRSGMKAGKHDRETMAWLECETQYGNLDTLGSALFEIEASFGKTTRRCVLEASSASEAEEIFRSLHGVPRDVKIANMRRVRNYVLWVS